VVNSILISKEICEDSHLSNNWPILENFLFNSYFILSKAVIYNFVNLIVNSALIGFQMIFITFSLGSSVWVASFRDETLSLSPIVSSGNITSVTVIV
jgi:hypothetical protein